jgi:hypothetical protein
MFTGYNGNVSGHTSAICNTSDRECPTYDNLPAGWFPATLGRIMHGYLDATFQNHWLGRDGPLYCPPQSPDNTPLGFFLWSYVKDKIYATMVTGVEDLNKQIRNVIITINTGMLARTWEKLEF